VRELGHPRIGRHLVGDRGVGLDIGSGELLLGVEHRRFIGGVEAAVLLLERSGDVLGGRRRVVDAGGGGGGEKESKGKLGAHR
jgi:hypothetical protein